MILSMPARPDRFAFVLRRELGGGWCELAGVAAVETAHLGRMPAIKEPAEV